jgi:hypothetical protein
MAFCRKLEAKRKRGGRVRVQDTTVRCLVSAADSRRMTSLTDVDRSRSKCTVVVDPPRPRDSKQYCGVAKYPQGSENEQVKRLSMAAPGAMARCRMITALGKEKAD